MIATQDAAGATTSYEYDAAGRVIASTDANGNRLTYAYDANDNMLSVTDKDGNVWKYTYDALGSKLTETDPVGNVLRFAYDSMGRMTASTDADGYTTRTNTNRASATRRPSPRTDGASHGPNYDYATPGRHLPKTTDPLRPNGHGLLVQRRRACP